MSARRFRPIRVTDLVAPHACTFFGNSEPRCPICRAFHTPGSAIPEYGLREAAEAAAYDAAVAAGVDHDLAAGPAAAAPPIHRPPHRKRSRRLASLPDSHASRATRRQRSACGSSSSTNSGSTSEMDGHVLYSDRGRPPRLVTCTRWREISSAEAAAKLGAATGVPCEFHLLNPLRGTRSILRLRARTTFEQASATGGTSSDQRRLLRWLAKVTPRRDAARAASSTALAALEAFVRDEAASGRVAFLIILTDGAPTPIDSGQPTDAAASAHFSV